MAAFEDVIVPRKKLATYGKAFRRRIPDYNLGTKSQAPESKQKSDSLPSRSPSVAPTEPKKLKSISRTSPHKSPSSTAISKTNVFDVPSSDDEASLLASKPTVTAASRPKNPAQKITNKETLIAGPSDLERRKRIKLSPARPQAQKSNSTKLPPTRPVPDATQHASRKLQTSLGVGNSSIIATRLKSAVVPRRQEEQRTPRKSSPILKHATPSTPSPQLSAVPDAMDVDTPTKHISPRGIQMWKELLDSAEEDAVDDMAVDDDEQSPVHSRLAASPSNSISYKPAGVIKNLRKTSNWLPRRRLIDSLVEQTPHNDEMEDEEPDITLRPGLELGVSNPQEDARSQSMVPDPLPLPTLSASQGPQLSGPKFTYSRQRSMLAEEDLMQSLALDMPTQPSQATNGRRPRRGSIPVLKPLDSFNEEDEGEDGATTAIRSVHELRQAGANNRFKDEIEDLLDRIGKPSSPPSSMRRSGLLDLASKVQDKNFVRQFRSNGVEQKLFVHLGQETDVIAGFIIISILMAVLCEASMPHIVAQLRRQGITRLLIRLIESQASIVSVIKDRKSNLSRVAQSLISEHNDYILKLPVWDDLNPQVLSPRTVALKCLEMMVRQTREAGNSGDIISKELTTTLFSIFKSASEEESWDLPQGKQAIDFYLALSTLESHSIFARTVHDESIWISEYLPIIADGLEIALQKPANGLGLIQNLILRLTLNVTNNNSKASDVFARTSLTAAMGQVIITKFKQILRFLTEDELLESVEYLILIIGVMINLAEWSYSTRESLEGLQGKDDDPLDAIVQLFVDNKKRASEVYIPYSSSNLRSNFGRLSLSKKVRRMLHLAISLSCLGTYLFHHQLQHELPVSNQGKHFAHW
jgi:hypothetical protein